MLLIGPKTYFLVALAAFPLAINALQSCNCSWNFNPPLDRLPDISVARYKIDPAPVELFGRILCNGQAVYCGSIGSQGDTLNEELYYNNSGCAVSLKFWGTLDKDNFTSDYFGTPSISGCPELKQTISMRITNPRNYISTRLLINGAVMSDTNDIIISTNIGRSTIVNLTAFNPAAVEPYLYIRKLVGESGIKSFDGTAEPAASDYPSFLAVSKVNSTTISIEFKPTSFSLGTFEINFVYRDQISSASPIFTIKFNPDNGPLAGTSSKTAIPLFLSLSTASIMVVNLLLL